MIALMEMVVNGVSLRKVSQITEELCGTKFSKSTVSELCKNLDPIMKAQLNRFLLDDGFPFLLVDALYLKIREDGRVRSRGVMEFLEWSNIESPLHPIRFRRLKQL
jgi:transposase-like protein